MKKVIPFLVGSILGILGYFAIGIFFCPEATFCSLYVVNFFQLGAIVLIMGALTGGFFWKAIYPNMVR